MGMNQDHRDNALKKLFSRLPPRNLFGRMLSFWSENRRLLLLVIIATALVTFIASLSPETRRSMVRAFFAQRALVILLLVFSLVTLSLLLSTGQRLDTWIFMLLNLRGYHPLWMDSVMWAFTQIGNGFAGILLSVLLYFIGSRRFAVELLLGILSLWLTVEIVKALVERSRPFLALQEARVVGWRERGKSFPSGHTAQAFLMSTLIANHLQVNVLFGILIYGVAVTVAFTRIYVGAHYPRDVIGGAILGSVWGILAGLVEVYLTTRMI